ncbi:MAG: ABC transporter substrate-binding protein [Nitrospinota bacterium]|nr:MAG: ABC transporter substrate-binding protein [Nitrospinota bacterium]
MATGKAGCLRKVKGFTEKGGKIMRKGSIWGLIFFLVLGLGTALYAAPTKLVLAHIYPGELENNEVHPAVVYFKKLVEERTAGQLTVEIFPGGQLGSEIEYTREAQAGVTVHSAILSSGAFSSFYRKYQAVVAPYLFPDRLTAWAFFDSKFFAEFMRDLIKETGLRYLGTMDDGGGFVALTSSLRQVRKPADFKGMRVRTEENPAHMAIMKALGASVVPMAWGEVATALATGVAHAQFNAPSILVWAKMWETQKYVSFTNHIYNTLTWVINDKFFRSLPPDQQRVVLKAAREAIILSRGLAAQLSERAIDTLKEKGMELAFLTPEELKAFEKLAKPAFEKWAVEEFKLDPNLIRSVRQEVERIAQELDKRYAEFYGVSP